MKYCVRCVIPDTRPGIDIGTDGVCSACKGHEEKKWSIDWNKRQKDFEEIVKETKNMGKSYDCIIPVSGGKDSTWQVVKCLEYGLRILAVTWKTPLRSKLGQENLNNLIRLGVDHIDYTINPEIEKRFIYKTLTRVGDPGLPMHMAIYAIPLRIAVAFDIPLIVWGESPHMEYGGTEEDRKNNQLNHAWLKKHQILQGTSIEDWIDDDLPPKNMTAFHLPDEQDFQARQLRSIFLGYYFPWDVAESLRVSLGHGFQVREEGPKVGYYNYADIDCDIIAIHHYFKWFKFGFTRLFDNLSIEIRNGRMSRFEAIDIISKMKEQAPYEDITKLCFFMDIQESQFWEIAESFRNSAVWSFKNGTWMIPDFIVPNWEW